MPTAGRDPGGRAPAPGSLRLVQALVNTLSVEFARDLLGTRETAAAWLTDAGLLPPAAAARSRWCSMQLCGARAKMRIYRARYYPGPVSPPRAAGPARTAGGRR